VAAKPVPDFRGPLVPPVGWHKQADRQRGGGHDKATLRLLDGLARREVATEPRLRPGTVLMREHGGVRYTVTVTHDGFV
jgi:hypothetical protein